MGYFNQVMQYGPERFVERAAAAGVDGLILPDLPAYEYQRDFRALAEAAGLQISFLVTPQTSDERMREIASSSTGFLYIVSSSSITGGSSQISDRQRAYFDRITALDLPNPKLIGFGISDAETFRTACEYFNGAIIGSAFHPGPVRSGGSGRGGYAGVRRRHPRSGGGLSGVKHLIVIGGPTASGKTKLAIEVAQHYGTEIISADSRQFYRELRIGNARPTEAELAAVAHHFIADRPVTEPLSAGRFAEEALFRLEQIFENNDIAVAVGGSGLYIRALCEGLDQFPPITPKAQQAVKELEASEGLAGLQRTLAKLDPAYYTKVDRQNGRRLQRALRICFTAGRPYSSFLGQSAPRSFTSHYFRPATDRAQLYASINGRVRRMLADGLEQEARALHPVREIIPLQTVGYQEWWPYLAGQAGWEETVASIQRNSRRYAKRQLTWFRDYATVVDAAQITTSLQNIFPISKFSRLDCRASPYGRFPRHPFPIASINVGSCRRAIFS